MNHPKVLACSFLALSLTGCTGDAPPAIAYDNEERTPAVREAPPPTPVRIVPLPQPLPLPGQLKTIRPAAPAEPGASLEQIAQQRSKAELGPGDATTINAITVWPFVEGALYQLYAAPGQITDIALQLRYRIEGDTRPWRPLNAFDDGSKVYIEFPQRIDQGEMPPLFVLGPDARAELVNYRVRRNYYIVDRLFAAAELRLGEDPQAVVRILRTDQAEPKSAVRRTIPDVHQHRER